MSNPMQTPTIRSALKDKSSKSQNKRSLSWRNKNPNQSIADYKTYEEVKNEDEKPVVHTDPISKLPPVTASGWLHFRPKKLKDIASRSPDPSVQAAIKRAKAARTKKLLENPAPYLDEIIVVGERVQLNERGISDRVLRNPETSADTIFFTPSYFPYEKDLNKIVSAKTVFSKVFAPGSTFSVENPVVPCEASEYNLLKEGLENRLYNLRMNLPSKSEDVVSMDVRNMYHVAEEINSIIQAIESEKSICTNYELNGQDHTGKGINSYALPISRIDNEKFQNLLRQFSFLVLQHMNHIDGYDENMGNMKPDYLITALEQQQISKEDMDNYIAEYETSYKIPDVIAQTLSATDAQDDIYSLMLESELLNLLQAVKKSILDNLKDPLLKTKFVADTKSDETIPVKEQLIGILKWILTEYSRNQTVISENIEAIHNHQTSTGGLTTILKEKNAEIFDLESKLQDKSSQLASAFKAIDSTKAINPIRVERTDPELLNRIAMLKGERDVLLDKEQREKKELLKKIHNLERSRSNSGVLSSALKTASNPKDFRFFRNINAIANAIKTGETPKLDINSPLEELYKELPDLKTPMSDICFSIYIESYMLKKLFTGNNEIYMQMNVFINTFLNAYSDKLDDIVHGMAALLKHTEDLNLKSGYYNISEDGEIKSRIPTLNKLYANILSYMSENQDVIDMCNKILSQISNKKEIAFVPNGFILNNMTAPIYMYNNTKKIYEEVNTLDTNNYKESIPYSLFFIIYILFTKETLKHLDDKQCPKPKIITDPDYFSKPASSVRVKPIVGNPSP